MTSPIAPYRSSHLCALHAAAPPSCPRCAAEWLAPPPPSWPPRGFRRVFVTGLIAATAFGAVIGTAIGFAAGAWPVWGAVGRPPRAPEVRAPWRPEHPMSGRSTLAATGRPATGAHGETRDSPVIAPPTITAPGQPVSADSPAAALAPIAPPRASLAGDPAILARLGENASDPEVVLARLQGLARSGVPFAIETRRLSRDLRDALLVEISSPRPLRLLPFERDGRIVGVKIFGVRRGSALWWAGVRSGDIVLAANGVSMADMAEWPEHVGAFPGDARAAVVEIERAGEHRVLVLRW